MNAPDVDAVLAEQVAFYRAWASTYDDAVRHDANERDRPELHQSLARFRPVGDVLELAGGTGNWTVELGGYADALTVVDSSAEALAINRSKLLSVAVPVEYVCTDIFNWELPRRYDVIFFSFWLSHVPPGHFDQFWQLVDRSLATEGRVFFIDSARPRHNTGHALKPSALVDRRHDPNRGLSRRALSDGREYRIVKVFWRPDALRQRLASLGFDVSVRETVGRHCIFGHGGRGV